MAPYDYVSEIVDLFVSIDEDAAAEQLSARGARDRGLGEDARVMGPCNEARLVLLGNLPVRASIWLEQYANQHAVTSGRTALFRLGEGACSISILGGAVGSSEEALQPPSEFAGRIGDLVAWLVSHVENFLVVPPDHEVDCIDTLLSAGREILILTGSDDAALVQAYRLVKQFVTHAREHDVDPPGAGLVIVGKEPSEARKVGDRISDTAQRFLGIDLPIKDILQKADGVQCVARMEINVGPTFGVRELLALLERTPREVRSEEPVREAMEDGRVSLHDAPELGGGAAFEQEEILVEEEVDSMLQVIDEDELVELEAAFDEEMESTQPEPVIETADEPVIAHSILDHFPALEAIEFECPVDERIALAVDPDLGRFHLVMDEAVMRSLGIARSWAMRHESLLRAAIKGLQPFHEGGLQVDLLVRDAQATSDLHGTGVHLHLLHGSTVIPLNNDKTAHRGF